MAETSVTGVAWNALHSATPGRRSEFGMNVDGSGDAAHTVPRPIPPALDLGCWQVAESLSALPSSTNNPRERRMSLDFTAPGSHNGPAGLYGLPKIEQAQNPLHNAETAPSPTSHHPIGGSMHSHAFDHRGGMDAPESHNYDLFSASPQNGALTSRYRNNASGSPSLTSGYSLSPDAIYSHSSFGDSVPTFNGAGSAPYDMLQGSLPSSYGSGKVSPLTPNDPTGGLPHSFPSSLSSNKEYSLGYAGTIADRRMPSMSGGNYQSEFQDEYSINGLSNGLSYAASPVSPYQERFPRYRPDGHFSNSPVVSSSVPAQLHQGHGHDAMHGVPSQGALSYRTDNGINGYEDISGYMLPSPHSDLPIRIPSVDETMARMKLSHPAMAGDLRTFIRFVNSSFNDPSALRTGQTILGAICPYTQSVGVR